MIERLNLIVAQTTSACDVDVSCLRAWMESNFTDSGTGYGADYSGVDAELPNPCDHYIFSSDSETGAFVWLKAFEECWKIEIHMGIPGDRDLSIAILEAICQTIPRDSDTEWLIIKATAPSYNKTEHALNDYLAKKIEAGLSPQGLLDLLISTNTDDSLPLVEAKTGF